MQLVQVDDVSISGWMVREIPSWSGCLGRRLNRYFKLVLNYAGSFAEWGMHQYIYPKHGSGLNELVWKCLVELQVDRQDGLLNTLRSSVKELLPM